MKKILSKISFIKYLLTDEFFKLGSIIIPIGIIGTILNFIFRACIGRILTSPEYGVVEAMLRIVGIFSVPITAVQFAVTLYVARTTATGDSGLAGTILLRASKKLGLYTGVVIIALIIATPMLKDFFQLESIYPLYVAGGILISSLLATIWSGGLQGTQRFISASVAGVLGAVAKLAVALFLLALGLKASGALGGTIALNLTMVGFSVLALRELLNIKAKSELDTTPIYRYLWPVVFVLFFQSMLGNFDMIAVKHFFPPEEAGDYARVTVISRNIVGYSGVFLMILFSKVAGTSQLGTKTMPLLLRAVGCGLLISISGALLCTFFPSIPVLVFHGPKYLRITPLVKISVWTMIPLNLAGFAINYLLAKRDFRFIIFLLPSTACYMLAFWLYHPSLLVALVMLAFGGIMALVACLIGIWLSERKPLAD